MNCASLSPISTACYPGILKHRCSSLDAHCALAIVSSVISYSSLAFTILIMLWPYDAINELGPRAIGFFIGICVFILLGALISAGRNWVIKVYRSVAECSIAVPLIYILGLIFEQKNERSFNGLELSVLFIIFNSLILLLFKSKYLKNQRGQILTSDIKGLDL